MKKNNFKLIIFFTGYILASIISGAAFTGCADEENKNEISGSGNIEATDIVISSKTPGQIKEIFVREGDMVKTNDILFIIDHDLLDIQLRQALASVRQAEAQLNLLLQGARTEDILIAEDGVTNAEINLTQAESDMKRFGNLFESGSGTEKAYDDAKTIYELRLNQLNIAEENLKKVKTIVRKEEIESARANLNRSQANADLIRKKYRRLHGKISARRYYNQETCRAGRVCYNGFIHTEYSRSESCRSLYLCDGAAAWKN
ncbi:MAG: biotin/lipoyl-binding protein [Ignavibacteria bacterium]|nr:biotin/lipoyl-binding protein [Ignavibacteria bacterium]